MKLTENFRVDTHDTDMNGFATASALMRYMQEAANLQHLHYGPTMDELRADGKAFIISRAALEIHHTLRANDTVEIVTWLSEAKGYGYYRYSYIKHGETLVCELSSFWGVIDIATRKPIKAEEVKLGFGTDSDLLTNATPLRFRLPRDTTLKHLGERAVGYSDCDMNCHMNNTCYPNMLCDFIPGMKNFRVASLAINYLKEAPYGCDFKVYGGENENKRYFRTELADGMTGIEAEIVLDKIF